MKRKRKKKDFEGFGEEDFDIYDFDNLEIKSAKFLDKDKDGKDKQKSADDDADANNLPDPVMELLRQAAVNSLRDVQNTIKAESDRKEEEDHEIVINAVYETDDDAQYPKFYRTLLSVQRGGITFGSFICQSLVSELKEIYDDLLFGLTDNLYLHATRSFTVCGGHACASTRFFWDEEKSLFPLVLCNVTDIVENEELVYLIIGDMVEDIVNRLEKKRRRKQTGGKKRKR